jgi:uncharacterized Zn-finger protein
MKENIKIVKMCSFCGKIKNKSGQWVSNINIGDEDDISYNICPSCDEVYKLKPKEEE